jgi:hypothetical protein
MSSSRISTITACGLQVTAGAGNVDDATTAMAVVAAVAITACCGPAAVGGCRGSATVAACCASTAAVDYRGSVVVADCCGPATAAAPRESSPTADVVLAAARDALDERRLMGTAASDLSTLAGARGGTVGATLRA